MISIQPCFDTATLQVVLSSLLGLQPASVAAGSGGMTKEETVSLIATDLFEHVPPPFNLEAVMKAKADDPSAMHVVLFQELERYNALLVSVRRSCSELLKGIQGLVVMSAGAPFIPSPPPTLLIKFASQEIGRYGWRFGNVLGAVQTWT